MRGDFSRRANFCQICAKLRSLCNRHIDHNRFSKILFHNFFERNYVFYYAYVFKNPRLMCLKLVRLFFCLTPLIEPCQLLLINLFADLFLPNKVSAHRVSTIYLHPIKGKVLFGRRCYEDIYNWQYILLF